MAIKRYLQGIAIVVLILGMLSVAMAITISSQTPSSSPVINVIGDPAKSFSISTLSNATVQWSINGTPVLTSALNVTTSTYTNNSFGVGIWNVTAKASNSSNLSEIAMVYWSWIVSAAVQSETAPGFTAGPTANSLDTSARINFTINQSNANTIVLYGNDSSNLNLKSDWENGTGTVHTISLSGLSKGTQYYYSVYAYNSSNESLFFNSPSTNSFTTLNPTAPNITSVTNESATNSAVNITFILDQIDAFAEIRYGTSESFSNSVWKNDSTLTRTKQLISLTEGTKYFYSVFAYNKANHSYFNNSTILNFTTVTPTAPNITSVTNDIPTNSVVNITFILDQIDAVAEIRYGTTESFSNSVWKNDSTLTRTKQLTSLTEATKYFYSVFAYNKANQSYFNNSTIQNFTTKYPSPTIDIIDPTTTTMDITVGEIKNLTVTIGNQPGTLSWYENGATLLTSKSVNASEPVIYTFSRNTIGTYNITANLTNANGTDTQVWTLNVHPTTYSTGNRIWDGSKPIEFSKTYSWTPMSFSGFYYNAKDDVGNENIKITVGDYTSRTISQGNLVYTTSPQEVSFTYSNFGKYQVIGFMAEKYFAGYILNTTPPHPSSSNFDGISAVGQGQLHKVLIDEDTKRTIAVGGTFALKEGYVLKATDIDLNARTMLLSLLKDGNEIDSTPLSADQTYIYRKRVGAVDSLPLIMARFDSVFSGQELQVAFLKGLFQISENPTIISNGNTFRNMEITAVSSTGITMENSNSISLSKGSTNDVMGDVKILVANNDDSALRFALSVEKTGDFEIRSTVYRSDGTNQILEWTPYNFGMNIGQTSIGFYYDLDDGVGSEKLNLKTKVSGGSIPENGLTYSTSPQEVKFTYTGFGKYQVIGFMAEKYFAGYTLNTIPHNPTSSNFDGVSAVGQGQLHKVLIDDDTKRTIAVGGTFALKEGYVLKATDIDLNARTMLLSLLKDGNEIDSTPLSADQTYVYTKRVGGVDNLPLIMVRFDSVFSGQELQVAFLKGLFQISENPTIISNGNTFGNMEITAVSGTSIMMENNNAISLDRNKNDVLMGNIRLKVADTDVAKRFYFAVDVTPEMIVNQLAIDAPTKAMAGDTIKIKATAGGAVMDNTTINIGTETGTTDSNGILNYTLPRNLNGTYSITASKTGYEKATQNIEIEKYIDYSLSLEAPSQANQFETITIKVLYNGTAMSGANVIFDNTTVGTSDSNGEVTYKLETSGAHNISASKTSYITVTRDIEIRAPYSEFKGLDINLTPNPGFVGEAFLVRSNITNVGTKSDSLQVDLIVNGTSVDNKTVTIGPGEKIEVNFTRIETIAGNVTVEVMGQSLLYEAKEKPTNYLLIGAILTVIGIVIIYILTSKGLIDLELLKHKFSLLGDKFNNLFKK